jgi:alginate O-acetyltransferase complex protein AlgI
MVFSSSLFLLYFLPVLLIIYYLMPPRLRIYILLTASLFFYSWGAPKFVFILIGSIIANYYFGNAMHAAEGKKRKTWLAALIILNLALLVYYKYTGFFIEQFNGLLAIFGSSAMPVLKILLPLGLSFITFQQLSYLIDVARRSCEPAKKLSDYALFVLFFPKILAGPIVRFKEFAPDIANNEIIAPIDDRLTGFFRFTLGLAKKMLIANVLGQHANDIFATEPQLMSVQMAWIGAFAYTFQIFFDFSAYSDMAIGLARMLGFKIKENFNNPYVSVGITEFWKRWHITLCSWLRDYLFLPVAFALSKRMPADRYFGAKTDHILYTAASIVTMAIAGFWHGAGWTFVLWGLYHGVIMALERRYILKYMNKAGRTASAIFTFVLVHFGWVMFRADSTEHAFAYYARMFSFGGGGTSHYIDTQLAVMLVVSVVFSFWALFPGVEKWQNRLYAKQQSFGAISLMVLLAIVMFIISLAAITSSGFNPFIYFRF